jgi:hypothetical protein
VVSRFGDATAAVLCELVGKALVNKGHALNQLGRCDEALVALEEVMARFDGSTEPASRRLVAVALVNKGVSLDRLDARRKSLLPATRSCADSGANQSEGCGNQLRRRCSTRASFWVGSAVKRISGCL